MIIVLIGMGFAAMIDPSVKVLACSHVSNVTGAIYDIQKIRALIGPDVFFIVDGSQSVPHFSVDVTRIGCDCFFWTPHKMLAYTGLGVMYLSKRYIDALEPMCVGWGVIDDVTIQWHTLTTGSSKWEAGTPNIIWAISLLASLQYRDWIGGYATLAVQEQKLLDVVSGYIRSLDPSIRLIWPDIEQERIAIFSFALDEHPMDIVDRLAENNICVRVGGHCAHPLVHHFQSQQLLRMSSYLYNTVDDIHQFFAYFLWKKV
jgi:cysteine desulfurase / selenocysteine lyase